MIERKASGAPQVDAAATLKSGAAPGGPLDGESAQRTTIAGHADRFWLKFIVTLITTPPPGNPPQAHP
jgi:hypothetical protein